VKQFVAKCGKHGIVEFPAKDQHEARAKATEMRDAYFPDQPVSSVTEARPRPKRRRKSVA
jgi:hypothetical protein